MGESQANPLRFGQRVLTAQTDYIQAKKTLQQLKQQSIKTVGSPAEAKALELELQHAEKNYQVKEQLVKQLLAVLSISDTETSDL